MSELDVSQLLTVDQAIALLDAAPVNPRVVEAPLEEAMGLRLAEDVPADRDYPPFDKSLMDGYAVRCADVGRCPVDLAVVGEIAAGQSSTRGIGPGETMAIMTGAPLPQGADGVVPVEDVEHAGEPMVRILAAPASQRNIARAGSDIRGGEVVLRRGMKLEAAQLAAAAMVGKARVKVFAAPRVAVMATGDEIVPFDQRPAPTQIRNSNNVMLMALLRRMDCRAVDLGIIPDRPELIRSALMEGLKLDALLVTGGMSMGRYDYVPQLLRELGVALKITKLRIKPGKPFIFGTAPSGCQVFGLPGNPVSGFVCTVRLVSRLLLRLAGASVEDRWLTGRLSQPLPENGPREFYQPAIVEHGEELIIHPLGWKGSADLFTLTRANALLLRKENEPALAAGDRVGVYEL